MILLAILSEIFGKDPKNATNTQELWDRVLGDIEGRDTSFDKLRKTCKDIIESPKTSSESPPNYSAIFQCLQKQIFSLEEMDSLMKQHLQNVLLRFKQFLHEPYKFRPNNFSIMPLALIVLTQERENQERKLKVEDDKSCNSYKSLRCFLSSMHSRSFELFDEFDLPFPRAAVLWTLVQHLASQGSPALKTAIVEKNKIKLNFDDNLFTKKQDALAETLKGLIKTKSSTGFLGGDSTSHWFEFACSCEGEVTYARGVNTGFSIFVINRSTKFNFRVSKDWVIFSSEENKK